jgi:multidrug efflux pump subunit AcrB
MLPFDNKSEFQVVVDMREGSTVEQTARVVEEIAALLETVPEISDYQAYVGTASPINFDGLLRRYYLREATNVADVQVNLVDRHRRDRSSHEIAGAVRGELAARTCCRWST